MDDISTIELDNKIVVNGHSTLGLDVNGIRTLVESGMRYVDIAEAYKITPEYVTALARKHGWMRPTDIEKLRKEIEVKQRASYLAAGKTRDVNEIKAQIWAERAETLKEKTYQIAEAALNGVNEEKASRMIQNPLGLFHITNVVRAITGEEKADAQAGQQIAINIGFLRSNKPVPVDAPIIDAD